MPSGLRDLLATGLAALATPVLALGLGEAELRSALGEPLDLVIQLSAAPDESVVAECFYLPRPLPGGLPVVTRATFAVESGGKLRVRTPQALVEPAMVLRMHASCPGGGLIAREYPLLLDPRPSRTVAPPVAAAVEAPPAAPATRRAGDPVAPSLRALAGDTLGGIAASIYPKNRRAREAYVAALREANPALAGLRPDEAIPADAAVVLPDLKAVAQRAASGPASRAPAEPAPAEAKAPPAKSAKAKREKAPGSEAPPRARKPEAARARESTRRPEGFVLRLSSGEVDLRRSRDIDDRTRAQLRERLTLLDADDQVSALLQLRNSLRQLENRVSEMQLRLAGSLPAPVAAPGSAPSAPAPAPAAIATPPRDVKPAPEATVATPPVPVEPPKAEASPAPAAPSPEAAAPKAVAKPTPPAAAPASSSPTLRWLLVAIAVVSLLLLVALVMRFRTRAKARSTQREHDYEFAVGELTRPVEPRDAPRYLDPDGVIAPDAPRPADPVPAPIPQETVRLEAADPQALRRRYLEERFPEIASGAIDLAKPESVVKGARLFYEDGALPRAVELLQFAIEEQPAQAKPWLALFEIFRLENLPREFGLLAARFKEHHGSSETWRKVQYIGREMDPDNPLYREDALDSLETIGYPNAAKSRAIVFDPLAENWLNAPMDFASDALAADLRRALLADAGLGESDLIPNPMPALKQVEMFNVA